MHPFLLRLSWPLVSFLCVCITIPLGYAFVWTLTNVLSTVLFFLLFFGAFVGLGFGAGLGGALVGWVVGQAQQWMLGASQPPHQRLRIASALIWAAAGICCIQAYGPVTHGDITALLPILLTFAVIASSAQWLILTAHAVPGSFRWGSGGMLGSICGTIAGLFLLGAVLGQT